MTGPCNGMLKLAILSQRWGWTAMGLDFDLEIEGAQAGPSRGRRLRPPMFRGVLQGGRRPQPSVHRTHRAVGLACGPQKYPRSREIEPPRSPSRVPTSIACQRTNRLDRFNRSTNQPIWSAPPLMHLTTRTQVDVPGSSTRGPKNIYRSRSGWLASFALCTRSYVHTYIHTYLVCAHPTHKPQPQPQTTPTSHTQIDPHDTTTITLRPPPAPTQ